MRWWTHATGRWPGPVVGVKRRFAHGNLRARAGQSFFGGGQHGVEFEELDAPLGHLAVRTNARLVLPLLLVQEPPGLQAPTHPRLHKRKLVFPKQPGTLNPDLNAGSHAKENDECIA